ncbi:Protein of unknown function [Acinetobacter boissieri]|uniref:Uncharacterized protein n=1 Tax=Acinetobacter boissieri TaxID=1219383 RepID=A0A1G6GK51_9GAMM|nr:Protein of unknown function [Acinetobacter boissieri]
MSVNIKYYVILGASFSSSTFAQELPPDQTIFFEQKTPIYPKVSFISKQDNMVKIANIQNLSLEQSINQAIIQKDWVTLERLLQEYQQNKTYDHILYDYGLGALYRYQGKLNDAIICYQHIVEQNPDLHYPRFDLAMMLFEDQRYAEAKSEFEHAKPFLSPQMQKLVEQFLVKIKRSQQWQLDLNLSYEKTNNVNQASNLKEITIKGAKFIRSEESLPQKAQGIDYSLGVSREKNIVGHHYAYIGMSLDGIYYWDNKDYSEQTLRASTGYLYKKLNQSWAITPFVQQNLLGNNRYSQNYGSSLEYSRQLSEQWKISANTSHMRKNYNQSNISLHYDGYSNSQAALIMYQPKANFLVYSGINFMQDHLADRSESSTRQGVRIGFLYLGDALGLRTNVNYAQRNFLANNTWDLKSRKDNEYTFTATTWHKQLQWHGFIPKLNYKYQKIDSNLALYKRQNSTWFMTIERSF